MRFSTTLYVNSPILFNALLAGVGMWWVPQQFTDNVPYCFGAAFLGLCAATATLGGYLVREIGPLRSLFALLVQAVLLIHIFGAAYKGYGIVGSTGHMEGPIDWPDALYFSTVTWTTLGYGDFSPAEPLRLLAAGQAFIGYVFLGLFIGLAANHLSNHRTNG